MDRQALGGVDALIFTFSQLTPVYTMATGDWIAQMLRRSKQMSDEPPWISQSETQVVSSFLEEQTGSKNELE